MLVSGHRQGLAAHAQRLPSRILTFPLGFGERSLQQSFAGTTQAFAVPLIKPLPSLPRGSGLCRKDTGNGGEGTHGNTTIVLVFLRTSMSVKHSPQNRDTNSPKDAVSEDLSAEESHCKTTASMRPDRVLGGPRLGSEPASARHPNLSWRQWEKTVLAMTTLRGRA